MDSFILMYHARLVTIFILHIQQQVAMKPDKGLGPNLSLLELHYQHSPLQHRK